MPAQESPPLEDGGNSQSLTDAHLRSQDSDHDTNLSQIEDETAKLEESTRSDATVHPKIETPTVGHEEDPAKEQRTPRPPNAWILYRSQKYQEFREKTNSLASSSEAGKPKSQAEISRIISSMWQGESAETKQHYEALAEARKIAHQKTYPTYRYRPRKRSKTGPSLGPRKVVGRSRATLSASASVQDLNDGSADLGGSTADGERVWAIHGGDALPYLSSSHDERHLGDLELERRMLLQKLHGPSAAPFSLASSSLPTQSTLDGALWRDRGTDAHLDVSKVESLTISLGLVRGHSAQPEPYSAGSTDSSRLTPTPLSSRAFSGGSDEPMSGWHDLYQDERVSATDFSQHEWSFFGPLSPDAVGGGSDPYSNGVLGTARSEIHSNGFLPHLPPIRSMPTGLSMLAGTERVNAARTNLPAPTDWQDVTRSAAQSLSISYQADEGGNQEPSKDSGNDAAGCLGSAVLDFGDTNPQTSVRPPLRHAYSAYETNRDGKSGIGPPHDPSFAFQSSFDDTILSELAKATGNGGPNAGEGVPFSAPGFGNDALRWMDAERWRGTGSLGRKFDQSSGAASSSQRLNVGYQEHVGVPSSSRASQSLMNPAAGPTASNPRAPAAAETKFVLHGTFTKDELLKMLDKAQ